MRKGIAVFTILLVILALSGTVMFYFPKSVSLHAEGMKYRLGQEHEAFEQQVQVLIEGKVYKRFLNTKRFEGSVDIQGLENVAALEMKTVQFTLDHDNSGLLIYRSFENGMPTNYLLGVIYFSTTYDQATIALQNQGNWNPENGFMLSAPASDRTEALEVSNKLMATYLKHFILD
ncbi:hypothetical protein [Paenibacillus daejeonensis]|uniref:hypothetical protein n=1 Tax=Paenibacillus daejeonensis TaxID=135193 RepID=UPI00036B2864|nr:hypothetical protein [Paenibacillus daejeonensis]